MAHRFGFASVNKTLNQNRENNSRFQEDLNTLSLQVITARVTDIILDNTHPDFDLVGGYSGIGAILYEPIGVAPLPVSSTRTFATPLLPNIKNYPLVDEVVILFYLPNKQINQNSNIKQYYYLNPIAIWNNQHLNAYPNLNASNFVQSTENKTYQAIEQGQTRKSTEEVVNYNYNSPQIGGSFFERANIHPLFSYAGDVIMEGRWGNSIRFGSTARIQNDIFQNDWSSTGEDGEPITIIRNGQPEDASPTGYFPIVEDINRDLSSIYLTSNQAIPLITPITNNPTVSSQPPQNVQTYEGSQVILNSDRLVFNSKADSIILNSQTSISIGSIGPIGLYSQQGDVVIQSAKNNIKLGGTKASQSVVKGDVFLEDFKLLLEKLQILSEKLTGEPQLKISTLAAGSLKETTDQLLNSIETYKSKIVKTI